MVRHKQIFLNKNAEIFRENAFLSIGPRRFAQIAGVADEEFQFLLPDEQDCHNPSGNQHDPPRCTASGEEYEIFKVAVGDAYMAVE